MHEVLKDIDYSLKNYGIFYIRRLQSTNQYCRLSDDLEFYSKTLI